MKLPFPRSLFCKYEYLIETRGRKTAFAAFIYLKYPGFVRKRIKLAAEVGKKHVREEGENLKRILEGGNVDGIDEPQDWRHNYHINNHIRLWALKKEDLEWKRNTMLS